MRNFKYKVGDKLVVAVNNPNNADIFKGDIVSVFRLNKSDFEVQEANGETWYASYASVDEEFSPLTKAKLNIGDKLVAKVDNPLGASDIEKGDTVIVSGFYSSDGTPIVKTTSGKQYYTSSEYFDEDYAISSERSCFPGSISAVSPDRLSTLIQKANEGYKAIDELVKDFKYSIQLGAPSRHWTNGEDFPLAVTGRSIRATSKRFPKPSEWKGYSVVFDAEDSVKIGCEQFDLCELRKDLENVLGNPRDPVSSMMYSFNRHGVIFKRNLHTWAELEELLKILG
jgi:hypothetical protein